MWALWLSIGFILGATLGVIQSVWVKKQLAEAQAELAELRERFL